MSCKSVPLNLFREEKSAPGCNCVIAGPAPPLPDQVGGKVTNVLRQESEGEVTQGETEGLDRSDLALSEDRFEGKSSFGSCCITTRPSNVNPSPKNLPIQTAKSRFLKVIVFARGNEIA